VFLFFPENQGMQAEIKYHNVTTDKKTGELYMREEGSGSVQVLSPRFVTNPQTQGHFEFTAFTGPGGRALALQLSGQVDIASMMKAMTSQENMDHYNFSVIAPIQTVVTDKDGNSKTAFRGIHFALVAEKLESKTISNSISWTAKKLEYSIEYQNFMGTVYEPPKAKEGDVDYIVSWNIGELKIPCYIIESRIIDAKINKKLFGNENIKDYYKNKYGEGEYGEYKEGMKKFAEHVYTEKFQTAEEAEKYIDNLTEDDIEWMENNKPTQNSGQGTPSKASDRAELGATYNKNDRCDIKDMTLTGSLGEKKVIMKEFKKNANNEWIETEKDGYEAVENQSKGEYGPEAGEALFESMVEHEMTHKRQYEQNCFPKTIDEVSKYEMEAYDAEIKCLKEFYDNNC
jgi:hypothetical protein